MKCMIRILCLFSFFFHCVAVRTIELDEIIAPSILRAHHIQTLVNESRFDWSDVDDDHQVVICCDSRNVISQQDTLLYVNKSLQTACYLSLKSSERRFCGSSGDPIQSSVVPSILKVDSSIVSFFQNNTTLSNRRHGLEDINAIQKKPTIFSLSIEFTEAYHRKFAIEELRSSLSQCMSNFLDDLVTSLDDQNLMRNILNFVSQLGSVHSNKYLKLLESIIGLITATVGISDQLEPFPSLLSQYVSMKEVNANCSSMKLLSSLKFYDKHAEIHDLHKHDNYCLLFLVTYLASKGIVQRLSITETPRFSNFEARGHIQTGYIGKEPYTSAGLTGYGQTVGVTDTGLDDLSSFFIDTSGAYHSLKTDRDGNFQPKRRKVVQYRPLGDGYDKVGGHGTHVVGTIVGSPILSEFANMRGIASDAKVAFYDIDRDGVFVSTSISDMFDASYTTGARVHTNSWGGCCDIYGPRSFDIDYYLYQHPDFLVIFSAGNEGPAEYTISVEASSKNALAVGAGQLRDPINDSIYTEDEFHITSYSSIGPTNDGRIKPDIIAPGQSILSAYAGNPFQFFGKQSLDDTIRHNLESAVHQMSGTSMAAPVVAGAALLIRQYFQNISYWATFCNPAYHSCLQGTLEPTGYLLKALLLHSGEPIQYAYQSTVVDGNIAITPKTLDASPNHYEGYGRILLKNILPLSPRGERPIRSIPEENHNEAAGTAGAGTTAGVAAEAAVGLHPDLDLIVFDALSLPAFSSMEVTLRIHPYMHPTDSKHPLKVTLCWYDPPHPLAVTSNLLLHDLDLFVITPLNDFAIGNQQQQQQQTNQKLFSFDHKNNIDHLIDQVNPNEQIVIPNPVCQHIGKEEWNCDYRVIVQSNTIPMNKLQHFALVITMNGSVITPIPIYYEEHVIVVDTAKSAATLMIPSSQDRMMNSRIPKFASDSQTEGADAVVQGRESNALVVDSIVSHSVTKVTPMENESKEDDDERNKNTGEGGEEEKEAEDNVLYSITIPFSLHFNNIFSSLSYSIQTTFSMEGKLQYVHMEIDAAVLPYSVRTLYAVIVNPLGQSIQIGGIQPQIVPSNHFYCRRWPEDWSSSTTSHDNYKSIRDVSAANVSYQKSSSIPTEKSPPLPPSNDDWKVILSSTPYMIWTSIARGELTLYFSKVMKQNSPNDEIDIDHIQRDIQFITRNHSISRLFSPLHDDHDGDNDDDAPRVSIFPSFDNISADHTVATFMFLGKMILIIFLIYVFFTCCWSFHTSTMELSSEEESNPLLDGHRVPVSSNNATMRGREGGTATTRNLVPYPPSYQHGNV